MSTRSWDPPEPSVGALRHTWVMDIDPLRSGARSGNGTAVHTPRPLTRTLASAVCLVLLCAGAPPAAADEDGAASVVTVAGRGETGYSGDGGAARDR